MELPPCSLNRQRVRKEKGEWVCLVNGNKGNGGLGVAYINRLGKINNLGHVATSYWTKEETWVVLVHEYRRVKGESYRYLNYFILRI